MAYPTVRPPGISGGITECLSPLPRFRIGWRRGGKKAEAYLATVYLDKALESFSGYIAADELYDGPFCVLSIVDNRAFKRLAYEVLDHDPTQEDIRDFFRRFKAALEARGRVVLGITTDGSKLYPDPIREVFGPIPHQVCEFHIIAELTKAVLGAVAKVRKTMKAQMPPLGRGRPSTKVQRGLALRRRRLEDKITDLFDHRYLFVKHHLTGAERRTLGRVSRGRRPLRPLRRIMDQVYRLFDRRCRTDTALGKLAHLRRHVRRFKSVGKTLQKLDSTNLEKALTFLDDSCLPPTSNAVERGNRRHRKMQKSIYRVRTQANIRGRIALDMKRDAQAEGRTQTIGLLHKIRACFP